MYRYDVFISYKHGGRDAIIAEHLHKSLERYRVPKALVKQGLKRRIERVFRDAEELAAGDLPTAIQSALEQSEYLVVICSPRSRQSPWVLKEVNYFREFARGSDHVLLLLVDGDPDTAFPPVLRGTEHLAPDVRSASVKQALSRLKHEKFRLLAAILGCSFDDLRQRHQERFVRRLATLSVVSLALVVAFAVLSALAYKFQKKAEFEAGVAKAAEQRKGEALESEHQALVQKEKALIAKSEALVKEREALIREQVKSHVTDMLLTEGALNEGRVDRALALLEENRPHGDLPDLRGFEWYYLLQRCKGERLTLRGHQGPVETVAFSSDGKLLASGGRDGVRLWETTGGAPRAVLGSDHNLGNRVRLLRFTPDNKTLLGWGAVPEWWDVEKTKPAGAAAVASGLSTANAVAFAPDGQTFASTHLYDIEFWKRTPGIERSERKLTFKGGTFGKALAYSPDGKWLVAGSESAEIRILDAELGTTVATYPVGGKRGSGYWLDSMVISADKKRLAVGVRRNQFHQGDILLLDPLSGNEIARLTGHDTPVLALAFTADGQTLASGSGDPANTNKREPGMIKLWDLKGMTERGTLIGHTGRVASLAFTADGKTLASASGDGTVKIWDLNADMERDYLKGHKSVVVDLAYSPDGRHVASASWDNTARVWDVATGKEVAVLKGHGDHVSRVVYLPNDNTIATAGWDGTIRFWNPSTGNLKRTLTEAGPIESLAFSADGRWLATGEKVDVTQKNKKPGTVRLWDAKSHSLVASFPEHGHTVTCLAFSPDSRLLVSSGYDNKVCIFDVESKKLHSSHEWHDRGVKAVAFSPDGRTLATAGSRDALVYLWDTETWQKRRTLSGHVGNVHSLRFTNDGKILLASAGRAENTLPGEVKLWDVATGRERPGVVGHTAGVFSAAVAPNNRTLAVGYWGGTLRLFRGADNDIVPAAPELAPDPAKIDPMPPVEPKKPVPERKKYLEHEGMVTCVAFSKDGKTIVSGGMGGVKVWDVATEAEQHTLKGHANYLLSSVAISTDGERIASAGGPVIKLWNLRTGDEVGALKGAGGVDCVAFSNDGSQVISGGFDKLVKVWDVSKGNVAYTLKGHTGTVTSVAITDDGKRIVSASNLENTIRLWDTSKRAEALALKHDSPVSGLALSGDGKILAACSRNGTIKVWDGWTGESLTSFGDRRESFASLALSPDGKQLAAASAFAIKLYEIPSGRLLKTFTGHKGTVNAIAFSGDGKRLVSASNDKTIRVWEAP
jgi:WD40 repeat protein